MSPIIVTAMIIAWLAGLILLEHRYPVVDAPPRAYGTNLLYAIAGAVVMTPMAAVLGATSAWLIETFHLRLLSLDFNAIGVGISWLDPVIRVTAMIVVPLAIYDIWLNLSHRLEHHVPVLWHIHRVHHSDCWINVLSFFRDHFLQMIWRAFFPMFTIGLFVDLNYRQAAEAAVYSQVALFLLASLAHSNIRIELPWLDRIIVTPQDHRIHHSLLPEHVNRNFSDVFPVFDMLFGTYVAPVRGQFPETGLHSGEQLDKWAQGYAAPFRTWWKILLRRDGYNENVRP